MKIAILGTRGIPNNYGGFEQCAEYLSVGLVDKGHDVTIYAPHFHPYKEDTYQLVQFVDDLMSLLTEYYSVKAVLRNIYVIAVLNELMYEIKEFKKEHNIEQISEFNKKIHNVVVKQPSSFIYERMGERYDHYLIDEFPVIFKAIKPIITSK